MLDLFYSGLTVDEQLEKLKNEIIDLAKKEGSKARKNTIKVVHGTMDKIPNKGALFIMPPLTGKFAKGKDFNLLLTIISMYDFDAAFITYAHLVPKEKRIRKEIKNFSTYIRQLISIILPKVIVCLGEEAQFSIFKTKSLMNDYHGKVIGNLEGIPVMTTYDMSYYNNSSAFEDDNYKNFLQESDWKAIKEHL